VVKMAKTPAQIIKEKRTCPYCQKQFVQLSKHVCKLKPTNLKNKLLKIELEKQIAENEAKIYGVEEPTTKTKTQEIEVPESSTGKSKIDQIWVNVEGMLPQLRIIMDFIENCNEVFKEFKTTLMDIKHSQQLFSMANEKFYEEWDISKDMLIAILNFFEGKFVKKTKEVGEKAVESTLKTKTPGFKTADKVETKGTDTTNNKYINLEASIDGETEKALRLKVGNETFWFPKSTIHSEYKMTKEIQTFSCDKWIMTQHGLYKDG